MPIEQRYECSLSALAGECMCRGCEHYGIDAINANIEIEGSGSAFACLFRLNHVCVAGEALKGKAIKALTTSHS